MEFLLLLAVTLLIAIVVSTVVILFFRRPIDKILGRIIGEEVSAEWRKFLTFALFVVGVSSGVKIWHLERYLEPRGENMVVPTLTLEYWGVEIYRTIIDTLGGMAWALLIFFVVALIAFVMVKRRDVAK